MVVIQSLIAAFSARFANTYIFAHTTRLRRLRQPRPDAVIADEHCSPNVKKMNTATPPQPRKRPRQSRSQQLVRAIREACCQILDEDGADRLTTQRIADVAGVNIASVYQYFPNKEAILAEVYEEQLARIAEQVKQGFTQMRQLSEHSFEAALEAIIDQKSRLLSQLYGLHGDFYLRYQQAFDPARRVDAMTVAQGNPSWENWFPQFLRHHRHRLRPGDIDTMAFMASHSLDACLQAALRERPQALQDPGFHQELLTLMRRYLLADGARGYRQAAKP